MFSNILVPIDIAHAGYGEKALQAAKEIANSGSKITLLTILPSIPPYVASELPQDFELNSSKIAEEKLTTLLQQSNSTASLVIKHGNPYHTILDIAEDIKADCIIISSHKPGWESYLLGSVAAKVVRHASCSVMVLR